MKRIKIKKGFKRDPVCEMIVPEREYAIEYRGMHFAFCSEQCLERFQDTPHLYIGYAGQKAPKQEGMEVIKNRRLRLDQPLSPDDVQTVSNAVNEMMGIREIRIEGDRVWLRYDLLQATEAQIECVIEATGGVLRQWWVDRLRRGCIRFFEENETRSMSVGSGSGKSCH